MSNGTGTHGVEGHKQWSTWGTGSMRDTTLGAEDRDSESRRADKLVEQENTWCCARSKGATHEGLEQRSEYCKRTCMC